MTVSRPWLHDEGIRFFAEALEVVQWEDLECGLHQVDLAVTGHECAWLYKRASTDKQAQQGYSLKTQAEFGAACADRLKNVTITHICMDPGRSAVSEALRDRPGSRELYEAIANGQVRHLIVYDRSRLSRQGILEWLDFWHLCRRHEVQVHFSNPAEPPIAATETDEIFEALHAWKARQEGLTRRNYAKHTVEIRHAAGLPVGPPPLGYMWDEKKEGLLKDPNTAPLVEEIFRLALEGQSARSIAVKLNEGLEQGKFTESRVRGVLRNKTYTGCSIYHRTDPKTGTKSPSEVPSKRIPRFVTADQFEELNHRRTQGHRQGQSPRGKCLLTGWLICGECGHKMEGIRRSLWSTYRCRRAQSGACSFRQSVAGEDLEAALVMLCTDQIQDREQVCRSMTIAHEQAIRALSIRSAELEQRISELASMETNYILHLGQLRSGLQQGAIENIRQTLNDTSTELEELRRQQRSTTEELEREKRSQAEVTRWLDEAGAWSASFGAVQDVQNRRAMLGRVLTAVTYRAGGRVEVEFDFPLMVGEAIIKKTFTLSGEMATQAKAREGTRSHLSNGKPYSFGYLPGTAGAFVKHPEEAPLVVFIFKESATSTPRQVAEKVNELLRKAGKPGDWTRHRVTNVLRNPVYAGKWKPNRRGNKCRLEECVRSSFPKLVSSRVWMAAQERLDED